jgi:hypothetical protein
LEDIFAAILFVSFYSQDNVGSFRSSDFSHGISESHILDGTAIYHDDPIQGHETCIVRGRSFDHLFYHDIVFLFGDDSANTFEIRLSFYLFLESGILIAIHIYGIRIIQSIHKRFDGIFQHDTSIEF